MGFSFSQHCEVPSSSFSVLTGCCEIYVTAYSGHSCPPLTLRLHCLWVLSDQTVFSPCDKCSHSPAPATNSSRRVGLLAGGRSPWERRPSCRWLLIYAPEIRNNEKGCRQQGHAAVAYVRFLLAFAGSYGPRLLLLSAVATSSVCFYLRKAATPT